MVLLLNLPILLCLSLSEHTTFKSISKGRGVEKRKLVKPQQEKARQKEQTKRVKVIVQAKLVVGYWELIPMESWDECLAPYDTSTVRVSEERRAEKKKRIQWWSQANWPRLKEALMKSRDTSFRGKWDVACLYLGIDRVPRKKISMFYVGLAGSQSHMIMCSLIIRGHCYQIRR